MPDLAQGAGAISKLLIASILVSIPLDLMSSFVVAALQKCIGSHKKSKMPFTSLSSCYTSLALLPSLRRAPLARRLSEGVPDEFQTGGARPGAGRNRAHHFDGKAPGKIHLRSARFHCPASQDRLVDQPNVERRREAPMDRPIRHHRNGVPRYRTQARDRDR